MAAPVAEGEHPRLLILTVPEDAAGERLDKALARAAAAHPGLSRSRLAQLIAEGAASGPDGRTVTEPRAKVKPGAWRVSLPEPAPAAPEPEALPLSILYEDADLIVVNKPAGLVVHPAPGAERGTLVNALLHHCGESLTGIGGERRPGIVHRIDKDTSGVLVAAKTAEAHQGLARRFAAHDIERRYLALCHGVPGREEARLQGLPGVTFEPDGWLRIEGAIGRHPTDRKRMAVTARGKPAVTRLRAQESFACGGRALAALLECRLETGRTHQIRVHAAHIGHPLVGDPVYGRARSWPRALSDDLRTTLARFSRQALHAASLGFIHPVDGRTLQFEAPLPADMQLLLETLRRNAH